EGTRAKRFKSNLYLRFIDGIRTPMVKALKNTRFSAPVPIRTLAHMASEVVSLGNIAGEGWFLTAEILELMHGGVHNVVCVQPFACLPNHVTGKGVMKELKRLNPAANVVAVDYDPGASEVNQLNRIKLMLATAFAHMHAQGGDNKEGTHEHKH
ncbi:MAG: 2-hydroxyglutaryl-CoA dehydratase, partial [Clostridiales bacterium]|nr:2-hydroxyglutaryl-CoA dehydratase [Clostridiales bacterium]